MPSDVLQIEPRTIGKHLDIPVAELKFDIDNVRYYHTNIGKGPITQEKMFDIISSDKGIRDLYYQILNAGGVYEELVVNSKNFVVEGNRRLACLRMILADIKRGELPRSLESKFNKVRCAVLLDDADPRDVDVYLAIVHVKGKRPWAAFDKAHHVYTLYKSRGMSLNNIAESIGMSKPTILRIINAYSAVEEYRTEFSDDVEWWRRFTYFDELFKRKDNNGKKLSDRLDLGTFKKWVHDNKFDDVRQVRMLPEIISNRDALKLFERHNAKEAITYIESKNPALSDYPFQIVAEAIEVLGELTLEELEKMKTDKARSALIKTLHEKTGAIMKQIEK